MKGIVCASVFLLTTSAFSQISYPMGDDQIRSEMSASNRNSYSPDGLSAFGITTGYAGFKIDDAARQGFDIDLHVLLSRISPIRFELNAGVVLYNSAATVSDLSPAYSGYPYQSNVYYQGQYSQPRFDLGFGLGYVGTEALFYFSEGKVRPYVAAGVQAVTWQMNQGFAATLAPSARAGIEVGVSRSFSGFAEARYMYGFPNLLNEYSTSLEYVTSVAFGVSFAPQL